MTPAATHRAYAWTSAVVAAAGLLVFGWSPTELLLLYWLDNAVFVLLPMLVMLGAVLVAPGMTLGARLTGLLIVGLLTTVFAAFVLAHGAMILFFDLASRREEFGLPFGRIPVVPMGPLILSLVVEPAFLASAAVVVGSVLVDLWPSLAKAARPVVPASQPPPAGTTWFHDAANRILVTQAALLLGGFAVMLFELPAAAALLLVALKLWLDLRRAGKLAAPAAAPAAETAAAGPAQRGE